VLSANLFEEIYVNQFALRGILFPSSAQALVLSSLTLLRLLLHLVLLVLLTANSVQLQTNALNA